MRVARRSVRFEQVEEGAVLEDRHAEFAIGLVDRVFAAVGLRRNVGAESGGDARIGGEAAALVGVLVADREAGGAARQVEQVAAQVGGVVVEVLVALVALVEGDEAQHRRRDRALAAEDVERNARRGAGGDGAESLRQPRRVDVAGERLVRVVEPEHRVDVPVPAALTHRERPVERARDREGVDPLAVVARAVFDQAPADEVVIGRRVAGAARRQRGAERVEGVGGVDRDRVQQVAVAGARADEQRQRRGAVLRIAVVVEHPGAQVDVVADFLREIGEGAVAFRRGEDVVVGLCVEAVGGGERLEVAGRRGRIERVVARYAGDRLAQRQVVAEHQEAAEWRRAAAPAGQAARRIGAGEPRDGARGGRDRILLHIFRADDDVSRRALDAVAEAVVLRVAVAMAEIGAVLRGGGEAVLPRLGDDVDNAGHRLRAVERRRARGEHLDPLDHARGDRVEVDRRRDAAARRPVDEAQPVDEHERALGPEVAKVDGRRPGADPAPVGRVAQVAAVVDLAVESPRHTRQPLKDIGDRREARLADRGAVDDRDRRRLRQRVAPDTRARDYDLGLGLAAVGRGAGSRRVGRRDGDLRPRIYGEDGQREYAHASQTFCHRQSPSAGRTCALFRFSVLAVPLSPRPKCPAAGNMTQGRNSIQYVIYNLCVFAWLD